MKPKTSMLLAMMLLTVYCNTMAQDDPPVPNRDRENAEKLCAERPEVPAEKCIADTIDLWHSPEHKAIVNEAKRASAKLLERCPKDWEQFESCAKRLNVTTPSAARELAYASAYVAMIERSFKRDEARKAATLGACRRSGWKDGAVRIGMTAEQVKFCGWGEPESVNRTVTQHGSAEQWVYGGGSYLYLENGRLVAIQD